jgi:hydroxyacylglutathione hydrolase
MTLQPPSFQHRSFQPVALAAFHDNYVWCLRHGGRALVVDPGDPAVVEAWLQREGLALAVILVTHHHPDHVGGLPALIAAHQPEVYGPPEAIAGLDHVLTGGETLEISGFGQFQVMAVPGHTRAHIAYYQAGAGLLFCGDTLFSAGCGRLFEGTPEQMYQSLQLLAALPDSTRVCCTHEYTLANLRFAAAVEPQNPAVSARHQEVEALRADNRPSLPVLLGSERDYNPFLRSHVPAVIAAAESETGRPLTPGQATFTALRSWKDRF